MRLWHQNLIHYLDDKRLLGQHRECCALRGKGWGKKHSVVDYVFKYDRAHLYAYHRLVMAEMCQRGFNVDGNWYSHLYCRKNLPKKSLLEVGSFIYTYDILNNPKIYAEHDNRYLKECLLNLKAKNAELVNGKNIEEWLIELDLKCDEV